MADGALRARAEAIEGFAAVLRDLRESIGTPSFRELSGRSRAISHTTLHEAAQGNRLPSWATTVEFVKACGADPEDYRERWQQASRAVMSLPPSTLPLPSPPPAVPDAPADAPDDEVLLAPAPRPRRRSRYAVPAVVVVGVLAAAGLAVALVAQSGGKPAAGGRPSTLARLTPADCPVHQANPPVAPPAQHGDAGAFIADITLPDCSHVHRGQTVTKVWRFQNAGTVPWTGYTLHRIDLPEERDQCQTIADVPIADTVPGDLVDIKTEITAPKNPGFCFVRFKMVDAAGKVAFPGSRPVNFQLIVD